MRSRSDLDDIDRRILTLLARVHTAWGRDRKREFLDSLGLRAGAWIARSGEFERWNRRPAATLLGGGRREETRALRLAKRLLFYCDAYVDLEPPLERTLHAYKLGMEVAFQPRRAKAPKGRAVFDETHDLDELALQRHACRFLVERGVPCYGVSFGRNEIDLLTRQGAELYVVEAKLLKHDDDWRSLAAHLAQLQQYMTQQLRARGILLVYNRSRVAIESPLRWIHGRFWVLPINLCPETASRTSKSVSVQQGKEKLIDLVPNVEAAASVRKRRRGST